MNVEPGFFAMSPPVCLTEWLELYSYHFKMALSTLTTEGLGGQKAVA